MNWDYRIVGRKLGAAFIYDVREIWYDDEDKVLCYSQHPAAPTGNTLDEIKINIHKFVMAKGKKVLEVEPNGNINERPWKVMLSAS